MYQNKSILAIIIIVLMMMGCGVHKHSTTSISNNIDSLRIQYVYLRDTVYKDRIIYQTERTETTEKTETTTHIKEYDASGTLRREEVREEKKYTEMIDSLISEINEREEKITELISQDSIRIVNDYSYESEEKVTRINIFPIVMALILIVVVIVAIYLMKRRD